LALLGRLSWERVDGFVMQASEKPAQERPSPEAVSAAGEGPLSGATQKSFARCEVYAS
jgi:hypothetical protein